ncbi:hypothetical protein EZV63_08045 [Streptomyces sp. VN1]|nr:hypothetical protein EZV63_08045 [Streptomyces sp. VN1]
MAPASCATYSGPRARRSAAVRAVGVVTEERGGTHRCPAEFFAGGPGPGPFRCRTPGYAGRGRGRSGPAAAPPVPGPSRARRR